MKQTAVEFLFNQLDLQGTLYLEDFEQAKEMEKEQIKHAYNSDRPNLCAFTEGTAFKEYYNKNFK